LNIWNLGILSAVHFQLPVPVANDQLELVIAPKKNGPLASNEKDRLLPATCCQQWTALAASSKEISIALTRYCLSIQTFLSID
jgi:hypothetical protein